MEFRLFTDNLQVLMVDRYGPKVNIESVRATSELARSLYGIEEKGEMLMKKSPIRRPKRDYSLILWDLSNVLSTR